MAPQPSTKFIASFLIPVTLALRLQAVPALEREEKGALAAERERPRLGLQTSAPWGATPLGAKELTSASSTGCAGFCFKDKFGVCQEGRNCPLSALLSAERAVSFIRCLCGENPFSFLSSYFRQRQHRSSLYP